MKERRKYTRYKTAILTTYIYRRGIVSIENTTHLRNISMGGISTHLPSLIKSGDFILVEIKLPFAMAVVATGNIMWAKKLKKDFAVGIEFDWISNTEQVAGYIQNLRFEAA